ncbi:hypothetical protein [Yoonia sediminilitoris]|uniref:Uncharacterized protein n=1 Tax=Yoonia sediminilitoris TaxID=1286148 RepID=A0A2T6KRQ2_9RHOB|nr:hypothetical protein [Yoonia sediminilitoris]PUB19205.1 hypothetical protein C8N45_101798 [Yoonia sediminilitoris]RCW99373.1 hypothetical protein DFP92_101798 [Yoonia sediminilitoris]
MVEQILEITRGELAMLLFSAVVLVQFLIFRAGAMQVLNKHTGPYFPGLSAALADIPARAEKRAKYEHS